MRPFQFFKYGAGLLLRPRSEQKVLPCDDSADMRVEAITGKRQVLSGNKNSVQLMLRISVSASRTPEARRAPLQIACVMDASGSMRGAKLHFAKRAVLKLVKHLTPQDTLHFVTYNNKANVVFKAGDLSEEGKEVLRQQIEAVIEGGLTNLSEGLSVAASLLGENHAGVNAERAPENMTGEDGVGSNSSMRRILLFSDGKINIGVKQPDEIKSIVSDWAKQGIVTSSFGIGTDFDEPLMRGIAAAGQGRYQFLGALHDIPKFVSKSVHNLIDLYASEATLNLSGGSHTTMSKVYGGHNNDSISEENISMLHLGDLHSDNVRVVLAELDVSPPVSAEQGVEFTALEWSLTCQRNGSPIRLSGQVQLECTHDSETLIEDVPAVQLAFAVRRATDMERKVAEHLDCRERDRAKDVKAKQIALLEYSLESVAIHNGTLGDLSSEVELLTVILDRAGQVSKRLEDDEQDQEFMARQCWQDRDDFSCASLCDLRDRGDSSDGSNTDDETWESQQAPPQQPPPSRKVGGLMR